MNKERRLLIQNFFEDWANESMQSLSELPASGSDRQYYRIKGNLRTAVAVYNPWKEENDTFVAYSRHFRTKGLSVPEVYKYDSTQQLYLLEDLGDETLLMRLENKRQGATIPIEVLALYKKALKDLAFLQIKGVEQLDITQYHQPASFGLQAMQWDLQYFKYCYLKPSKIIFDENLLEQDFRVLTKYLGREQYDYFMFRDFQSRNIMVQGQSIAFIDYQGGKWGPLQYDVVSLLFQAKANLSPTVRADLLDYYMQQVAQYIPLDQKQFKAKYYGFVLIRTLQVLGAYGFKGLYQRKEHFIESIPFALKNLEWLLQEVDFPFQAPHLFDVLKSLVQQAGSFQLKYQSTAKQLTIRVKSFSYKKGIPQDPSGNGGGFVFDCRFIHNPGRYEPYKKLTGRDAAVIQFFKEKSSIDAFVEQCKNMIDQAVQTYIDRGFAHLCINFGCTGGQHRSVYSADRIAEYLDTNYPVKVLLQHREQERKQWKN